MSKMNLVGHCYRPSANNDKVYMCCIRQGRSGVAIWTVLAKWGRRGKKLSNQSKGTFSTEAAAIQVQLRLWAEQQKGGYLDIESSAYQTHMITHHQSPLTMKSPSIVDNLEPEDGTVKSSSFSPVADDLQCERCGKSYKVLNAHGQENDKAFCPDCMQKSKELAEKRKQSGEDEVLICVDNSGMDDRFDVGIEYLVEEHNDRSMIYVYDKMGRKDEYFRVRFISLEQWNRKQGKINVTIIKNREPVPGAPKFAEFKPGDKITIIPPATPLPPRQHFTPAKSATLPVRV